MASVPASDDEDFIYPAGDESGVSPAEDVVSLAGPTFKVGDSFRTFEDIEKNVRAFENFHYVKFWKREARTVEAAKKRVNRYLNPSMKYYQLKYTCIHGGQAFRPKGKGQKITS